MSQSDIFCVSDRYIFVSLTDLFLRLSKKKKKKKKQERKTKQKKTTANQGYLCVSDRFISVPQIGLFLYLRQVYFRVSDMVISVYLAGFISVFHP